MENIIAHRGASKEAPENTIASINRALDLGANFIEIDVRLSKDRIPVVIHDPSPARMIGVKSAPAVNQMTLAEIQQFDIGKLFGKAFIGEKIPTLLDVLNLNWKKTGLMIEIKKSVQQPKVVVKAVFEVLAQTSLPLPFIIIGSFSPEIISEAKNSLDQINQPIELIGIAEKPDMIDAFIELDIKRLALWYKLISPELINYLEENGIDIWSFTIDDLKTAQFLISLGVNGIISNDPQAMIESKSLNIH